MKGEEGKREKEEGRKERKRREEERRRREEGEERRRKGKEETGGRKRKRRPGASNGQRYLFPALIFRLKQGSDPNGDDFL